MRFRSTSDVLCVSLFSLGLAACAAGGADSPPEGDGGSAGMAVVNTGAGGAPLSSGAGGTTSFPGGQFGSANGGQVGSSTGGYAVIPPLGTGGTTASGSGGSTGSAGSPPSGAGGGTTGPAGSVTVSAANMIDDLEDGDGSITSQGGRVGAWYTYNDQTAGGTQTPAMGDTFVPSDGGYMGGKCAHTSGSGFTTWGAGFGFDLNNDGTSKKTYSVGSFTGVAFYAKGTPFRLKVLTSATVPSTDGGSCTGMKCGDNFGTAITATADYQEFVVPFSSLTQEGWGTAATFDPATVIGIQFQVGKGVTFDISIDDVGFY